MNRKNWIQKRKQIPNKQERNFRIACGLLPFFKRYPSIGIYLPILEEVDVLDHCGFQLYDQPNDQHYVYRDSKLLSKSEFEAIQWSAPKVESESVMRFYPLDQLERGVFGILEPKGEKSGQQEVIPSMIIVPLVAFCDGYRKGYGKGYYDRYLQNHPQSLRVGIAFDQQEASFIHEQWDQRLDVIITETRVLIYPRCSEE
ncbi:5-formyltetrahydrofolate cyclo-ligase [Allobaculum stercoricanis]|uniref:5-formyltetrahydrofolate cyclo-ligase n=1 Tax=Allobaculum stercoricanis TaxID=174709 RepID=UPI0023F4EEC6|nr:5-formyltetrahydrofolate cyclo-ligase [Allobaculum stercoricanis]